MPPLSLLIGYWMLGAFFMATKRLAEYRQIGAEAARRYRASFLHYDETKLLLSIVFYITACAFFLGIFTVRFSIELILGSPLFVGFFVVYLRMGLRCDSPGQHPEKLYREPWLMGYLVVCLVVFVLLIFTRVPWLNDLFRITPNEVHPLWVF
jgi:decaprenyl-phosphate phosphoribosyltransferase